MKLSDKLALKRSEVAERLNELNGKDELTAEERQELEAKDAELRDLGKRWRTAVEADDALGDAAQEEREEKPENTEAPEAREWNQMVGRVELRNYLGAIANEKPVQGVEAEVQQELSLRSNEVPWLALAPFASPEDRAVTVNTNVENKVNHEIIARVFARSATAFLGVEMPMVGVGEQNYPIISSAGAAETRTPGQATTDRTLALEANLIKPTRLTVTYTWQREQAVVVGGLEEAIRNDMSQAMSDALDKQILTGDGQNSNVRGFLTELADPTAATTEETFLSYNTKTVGFVDGIYATGLPGVKQLVGPETYRHMAVQFLGDNPVNSESAEAYLRRVSGGVMASANMKAAASKKQDAIVARTGIHSGHAYAPVWQGVSFIRDEITKADSGEVKLTAIALFGFKIVREAAYSRVNYQVAK